MKLKKNPIQNYENLEKKTNIQRQNYENHEILRI